MILEKPTYQYLTNETQRYASSGKCDDLKSALAELERIAYANTLVLAEELFRKVVMPFCVEHRYTFAVIRGEARLTPIDEEVPQAQLIPTRFQCQPATLKRQCCLCLCLTST